MSTDRTEEDRSVIISLSHSKISVDSIARILRRSKSAFQKIKSSVGESKNETRRRKSEIVTNEYSFPGSSRLYKSVFEKALNTTVQDPTF